MTAVTNSVPVAGDTAPEISLASTSGDTVSLAAFRGNKPVLLAFFPLAFTGTCTKELCAFSEDFDQFAGAGVEVLPISVDAVPSLREYKKAYSMKVELLSDFKRGASRAYGVLNEEKYYANRSYFLIDKSGTIRWSYVEEQNGLHRDNAQLLAEISKLSS
jgi:peroxiredoxin